MNNLFEREFKGLALDIDRLVDYNWEKEVEDFEQQLFEENAYRDHVFVVMCRLSNAVRVMQGQGVWSLNRYLWNELLKDTQYFECDNCGYIFGKVDPIPPEYWQMMEGGEIAPAGFCVKCGCGAFPV